MDVAASSSADFNYRDGYREGFIPPQEQKSRKIGQKRVCTAFAERGGEGLAPGESRPTFRAVRSRNACPAQQL
jgi:hypothetical protein